MSQWWWRMMLLVLVVVVVMLESVAEAQDSSAEASARNFLQNYHTAAAPIHNSAILASWDYFTNLNPDTMKAKEEAALQLREFNALWYNKSRQFVDSDLAPDTRRTIKKAFKAQLSQEDAKNFTSLLSSMATTYSTATVCPLGQDKCLPLEPGLTNIMATTRDYQQLRHIWSQWRNNVSRKMRPKYLQYLELMNLTARVNNYTDAGEMWRDSYESEGFEGDMLALYEEVAPLYRLMHAYVRHKLAQAYDQLEAKGPLPACVLGDMWGRFWINIYPLVTPYRGLPDIDVTGEMLRQNYSVPQMFKMGEEMFTSMGLKPLPATFWTRSMLERPTDGKNVTCHASAWDFSDGKDFRIKMCTQVNMEDFMTIHHELGHVQYFMQYAHLPLTHRQGANDGFHEAIGELLAMVMSTPDHLSKIGLLHNYNHSPEGTINYLVRTALHTLTTLPFHLVNDLWRWRVWRGEYQPHEYNKRFWQLKEQYLGVVPPVDRDERDLDPPSLFHIAHNYDMVRYFTRTVLQFQLVEGLCRAAGHSGPLHTCDFHGSKAAGELLASGLAMGSSKHWQEVLFTLTGERKMSTAPLLAYFAPLQAWLTEYNLNHSVGVGWGENWTPLQERDTSTSVAAQWKDGSTGSLVLVLLVFYLVSWHW